jgi:hypothetical protein
MARLPHADRAVLDIRKIEEYCLSPAHPRGRHKARVFREALGPAQNDAQWLRQALLDGLRQNEATEVAKDDFGRRFRVDIRLARHGKRAVVRTVWMTRSGEQVPRFVTCWVL